MKVTHGEQSELRNLTVGDVLDAGAFLDEDGDLNIILDNGKVACLWTPDVFVRDETVAGLLTEGVIGRLVRPGESFTLTF